MAAIELSVLSSQCLDRRRHSGHVLARKSERYDGTNATARALGTGNRSATTNRVNSFSRPIFLIYFDIN
jgi:hypothetical protein